MNAETWKHGVLAGVVPFWLMFVYPGRVRFQNGEKLDVDDLLHEFAIFHKDATSQEADLVPLDWEEKYGTKVEPLRRQWLREQYPLPIADRRKGAIMKELNRIRQMVYPGPIDQAVQENDIRHLDWSYIKKADVFYDLLSTKAVTRPVTDANDMITCPTCGKHFKTALSITTHRFGITNNVRRTGIRPACYTALPSHPKNNNKTDNKAGT